MSITNKNIDARHGSATGLNIPLQYTVVKPAAVTGNEAAIVAAVVPNTAAGGTKALTIAAQPDVPRTLNCGVSVDADADAIISFYVTGLNQWGEPVYEWVPSVTLAGGVGTTTNAYSSITGITARTDSAAAIDGTDRVRVGYGPDLGLPYRIAALADISVEETADITTTDYTAMTYDATPTNSEYSVDLTYQTFTPGGTSVPDGTFNYRVTTRSTYGRLRQA